MRLGGLTLSVLRRCRPIATMKLEDFRQLRGAVESHRDDPEASDLLRWLREQQSSDRVALYADCLSPASIFAHAVLVPSGNRDRAWEDLNEWSGNPFDSPTCALTYGGGQGARVELHRPWDEHQPAVLQDAEQLVFGRSFAGRIGQPSYFELAQSLTLAHGLHWLEERQEWCRFDGDGDVVARAGILQFETSDEYGATLIWIDRELLERHMAATDTCLAQMFDCSWMPDAHLLSDMGDERNYVAADRSLSVKFRIGADASGFRGVHFLFPARSAQDLGESMYAAQRAPREFETFLVHDWKNARQIEWSCDPKGLASYFDEDSSAPYETSPVFFKPQVLDRFKQDREKFRISDRTISCRDAWSLKTYDVNEAGQVHTYLVYLGHLPLSEQRYWKSFNEAPKAGISERAYVTDFEGNWDKSRDPLRDLKHTLQRLDRSVSWFRLKQPDLMDHLNYPLTAAHKPWDDVLIDLAKLVVEGLEHAVLKARATAAGRSGEATWRSIRWLQEALLAAGIDPDRALALVSVLVDTQQLRSKLSAHAGVDEAQQIRRRLLSEHRTPRAHVAALAEQLDASLAEIAEILPG